MSVAEKFDEFCKREEILARFTYFALVREAFYAGAEARNKECREIAINLARKYAKSSASTGDYHHAKSVAASSVGAEIDHFRSHK